MTEMTREIQLPDGFSADTKDNKLVVSAHGKTAWRSLAKEKATIHVAGSKIVLTSKRATKRDNALLNALQSHVQNLVHGLQKPFQIKLSIVFSHFPMTVTLKGDHIEINNFMGEKKSRRSNVFPETKVEIKGKDILISGANKEWVGQTAANLENATRVMGKDRRVYQDGIFITGYTK